MNDYEGKIQIVADAYFRAQYRRQLRTGQTHNKALCKRCQTAERAIHSGRKISYCKGCYVIIRKEARLEKRAHEHKQDRRKSPKKDARVRTNAKGEKLCARCDTPAEWFSGKQTYCHKCVNEINKENYRRRVEKKRLQAQASFDSIE